MIDLKFIWRYQHNLIVPLAAGAKALELFWNAIAHEAMVSDWLHETPEQILSVTAGAFHVTMSCLDQAVPWVFVQDFATQAAESVAMGLLDTFDAFYEQMGTGKTLMVSFRIVNPNFT